MPSPTAGLFGGLATGIFGRMREHEDEQRKMDFEEKQSALKGLSDLLEHATPDTRPIIYKQMADVMKLKGKHRGVWDMLTGQGRDDYHNQLSSSLDQVFGNVVGPQEYEKLKPQVQADLSQAPAGGGPAWAGMALTQTPDRTAGKVALRDPIAEHLDALRQQYGLQNDRRSAEIELRNKLVSDREAANDLRDYEFKNKDREHVAQIDAEKKVRALATTFALQRQSKVPTDEDYAKAAEQYAAMAGLDVDKLKAQIGFLTTGSQRNLAQAQSAGGVDKPITPYQQYEIDQKQRLQAAATYEKWNKAKATITKLDSEQQALRQQINQLAQRNGVEFDEANGVFLKDGKVINPLELDQVEARTTAMLTRMAKLTADKAAAANELQGHRSTLEGQFPSLYTFGDQWSVTPNPEVGGLAPAGAPRTGNPPEWKMPLNGPSQSGAIKQYKSSAPIPKGTIIDAGPKGKFKVVGVAGKDKDGTVIHDIVPVTE